MTPTELRDYLHGLEQRTDAWSQALWWKAWRAADALEAMTKERDEWRDLARTNAPRRKSK